jgi:hypothetical protein
MKQSKTLPNNRKSRSALRAPTGLDTNKIMKCESCRRLEQQLSDLLKRANFGNDTPPGEQWHVMAVLESYRQENEALKRDLAYKNETANTFMAVMGWLDRMVLLCAHLRGWQCVRTTTVTNWQTRATLHCRIAGQYETSDERLCGVNDGRCEIYNDVCKTISEQNDKAMPRP